MGYYDSKGSPVLDKSYVSSQNNSILLPELKSITPLVKGAIVNRKKSVEKISQYEGVGSPHAPYQIYKHSNGKIELRSIGQSNPKMRPQ